MAQSNLFICDHCSKSVEAWDEGNPYYFDDRGVKRYAYHPDHENRARCVGNDSSHLCLKCGEQFLIDSEAPLKRCPACAANSIADAFHLEGKACPFCKTGVFRDSGCYAIS